MKKGFTLIEILIGIAIATILFAAVAVPFKKLNDRQALTKETANVATIITQARSQTLSSKGGNQHGVHLESGRVVLFAGSTYNQNDSSNISISLNPLVNITNIGLTGSSTDIVFQELTGTASVSGTFSIALVASSTQYKTITINATGVIDTNL